LLTLDAIASGYRGLQILHGVDLHVGAGEIVALIGANGAGKTTTLRTISGLLQPTSGSITFDGRPLGGLAPHDVVRAGVVQVAEERELFPGLSVRENLDMGAFTRSAAEREETLAEVHELFPILHERGTQIARTMSGGQQQMLAIGRALMARPRLLMLDEPSLGLAPKLVADVFDTVRRISGRGITVLIVEQNAQQALRLADRAYVLESGTVSLAGDAADLLDDPRVRTAYLGLSPEETR
jgi:branched-chain amino acid transport system ATP-binding protein